MIVMTAKDDRDREKASCENLSKFFYELAKTIFTAIVVGDVVTMFLNEQITGTAVWLFFIGLFATVVFAFIGFTILKK